MGFKLKSVKTDIELDFSDIPGIDEKDKLIKPVKVPVTQNILEWANKLEAFKPEGETEEEINKQLLMRFDGDLMKAAEGMSELIDFWYEKGSRWWMSRLEITHVMEIFSFLVETILPVKKK